MNFTPPSTPEREKNVVQHVEIYNIELVKKEGRTHSQHPLVFQSHYRTDKPTTSNYSTGELETSRKHWNQRANRHYKRYGHWYEPATSSLAEKMRGRGEGDIANRVSSVGGNPKEGSGFGDWETLDDRTSFYEIMGGEYGDCIDYYHST